MFHNKGLLVFISLIALISVRAAHAGVRVYRPGSSFSSNGLGNYPGGSQRVYRTSQRNNHRRSSVSEETQYSVSRPLERSSGYEPQSSYAGRPLMDNRVNGNNQYRRYNRIQDNPNRRYDPYGRRFGRRVVYANANYGYGYNYGSNSANSQPAFSLQLAPKRTTTSTRSCSYRR